jgi:hypothetical protein
MESSMLRTTPVILFLSLAAAPLSAQEAAMAQGPVGLTTDTLPSKPIEPGGSYAKGKGRLHRALLGGDYRQLWGTRIWAPVLDLKDYAGGLHPTERGGGKQTTSLHLLAEDGRQFSFRSVNKIGYGTIAPELRGGLVGRVWQDEVSALYPAGALVVPSLLQAAGVVAVQPHLFIMPDDPSLGRFRAEFAGMLGTLEEWPTPPFAGAREIVKTDQMYQRIVGDPRQRADSRAFLAARLMDMYIGDIDRHEDQWLWLNQGAAGNEVIWEPLPIDRDYALVGYHGLLPGLARIRYPELVRFGDHYPSLVGLNWHARFIDRRLLGELDLETWDSVAQNLTTRITDSIIDRSVRQLPTPFYREDGADLIKALRHRRDELPEVARRYYRMLAQDAEVFGSGANDEIRAARVPEGLDLTIRTKDGQGAAIAYYHRRFKARETREVRVFTGGGTDTVHVSGTGHGPELRIVSNSGTTAVSDVSRGRRNRIYASKPVGASILAGSGRVSVDGRPYGQGGSVTDVPAAPRDWGHAVLYSPWISTASGTGTLVGAGATLFEYGFRHDPYALRLNFRLGYGIDAGEFGSEITGDLRRENSATHIQFRGYASGADVHRFYGFGNETSRPASTGINKVYGDTYQLSTTLGWSLGRNLIAQAGPVLKYSSTDFGQEGLIRDLRPYGSGEFGELGAAAGLSFDSRDTIAAPTRGAHLVAEGHVYPALLDVRSTFGSLHGEAATYLTVPMGLRPTLALRLAGTQIWGAFPYQEGAFVGGQGTVRGLYSYRFIGNASAYGNAELRLPLTKFDLLAPGELGVFGLADVGRVWLDGESSNTWHSAFGGGVSIAYLNRKNTVTVSVARGDGRTALYLRTGFMF